jgi:hypothetical protein
LGQIVTATVQIPQSPAILGNTEPRLWTVPLRELTPATSYGFAVCEFARDVLGEPLDPWQEWLAIHAGELLEDGRPRFRQVVVLVARQAGKTHLLKTLALFWLFVENWPLVVGMSTNLNYAMESWLKAVDQAETTAILSAQLAAVRLANGEQEMRTVQRARYKVAASNRRGGRSLSIDRLILDELREHHDWSAWNASVPAMNARPHGQVFAISNQGDDTSVVLESLRAAALGYMDGGEGDPRLGLFEWSAPDGCELDDPEAIAAANPNAGRRVHWDDLLGPARRAKAAGGEEEAGFRTEILCQRVRMLNPAVDPGAWMRCKDPGDLTSARSRLAVCLDVSPSGEHATLAAAAVLGDDRVRVETVAAWEGPRCTDQLRRDLPGWMARLRPQALGWFPAGPAAALTSDLADRRKSGARGWPPRGVTVSEIRGEMAPVVMGFAEQVAAGRIAHSGQALLDAHVGGAERLRRGDTWVFSRKGEGNVDAAYAAAGAVHLARSLPPRLPKPFLITAD